MKRILFLIMISVFTMRAIPAKAQVSFILNATLSTDPSEGSYFDGDGVTFQAVHVSRATGPGLPGYVSSHVDVTFSIPYDPANPYDYPAAIDHWISTPDGCNDPGSLTASALWHQLDYIFGQALDAFISSTVSCGGPGCYFGETVYWYGAKLTPDLPPMEYGDPSC